MSYTPNQIDAMEWEAWVNNQDPMTDEDYDQMLIELYPIGPHRVEKKFYETRTQNKTLGRRKGISKDRIREDADNILRELSRPIPTRVRAPKETPSHNRRKRTEGRGAAV